ncbi:B3 domain-containing transcription factor VRN1-like isoform X3 [Argentina anserina]|uniref:B3 domain-containing transcription factor VRN1-like isoform X3 n=1 Tax=Argentina anserina TaxID=57926 RepID=UPI0021763A80|nr:B3 domain-containing transcription factor VRN1-like isoform X3 [Potentilla anserina]
MREKNPGFNKALQDGKLEIQSFVAMKYGNFLARSVLLKVPNGAMWPVKLTRSVRSTWLEKGWLDVAKFYSLEEG